MPDPKKPDPKADEERAAAIEKASSKVSRESEGSFDPRFSGEEYESRLNSKVEEAE